MDKRSFIERSASVVIGSLLVLLGAIVVPLAGIACAAFIEWYAIEQRRPVEDDAMLGGFVIAGLVMMLYAVFGAPVIWRRRPLQASPDAPEKTPTRNWYEAAREEDQLWRSPSAHRAYQEMPRDENPTGKSPFARRVTVTPFTPAVVPQPVQPVEEYRYQPVQEYRPHNAPTTLMGFPAAIECAVLEAEEEAKKTF